jgi:hypothetical protein
MFLTLKTFIFVPQIKTFLTAKPSPPSRDNALMMSRADSSTHQKPDMLN